MLKFELKLEVNHAEKWSTLYNVSNSVLFLIKTLNSLELENTIFHEVFQI